MAHIHLFEYAFFPLTRRSVSEDGLVRHSFLAKGDPLCGGSSVTVGDITMGSKSIYSNVTLRGRFKIVQFFCSALGGAK